MTGAAIALTGFQFVLKLTSELKSAGFDIWLDQLDIRSGSRWDDVLEEALDDCDIFIVILIPNSVASVNVKDEFGYAIDSKNKVCQSS